MPILYHHLKLHPWTAIGSGDSSQELSLEAAAKVGPVHSWQYDEVVFNDPFQSFLNILLTHPPTPLPKAKRRPIPFHVSNPETLDDTQTDQAPEFTVSMIQEEAGRLDKAKKQISAEQERLKALLSEREKELERLNKLLEV